MPYPDEQVRTLVHNVKVILTTMRVEVQLAIKNHRMSRKLGALILWYIDRAVDVMNKFLDKE